MVGWLVGWLVGYRPIIRVKKTGDEDLEGKEWIVSTSAQAKKKKKRWVFPQHAPSGIEVNVELEDDGKD